MHVAGAFSCLEIVDSIYQTMKEGDTFIMSKGHGAMAQYVILEDQGRINLDDYCNGPIGCHPDLGVPGIAAATGSLGHGLGIAVGIAYADSTHNVYCLISDGELMEGSTWESLLLGASLGLKNLQLHVDYNGMHSSGDITEALEPLRAKLDAFGWEGAVIHETVKGWPISYMMGDPVWHYKSPSPEQYQQALKELA